MSELSPFSCCQRSFILSVLKTSSGGGTGRGLGIFSTCSLLTQIRLLPGFSNFVRIPSLMYWDIEVVCLNPRISAASFWLMRIGFFWSAILLFRLYPHPDELGITCSGRGCGSVNDTLHTATEICGGAHDFNP